jgi:cell division protein FtsB
MLQTTEQPTERGSILLPWLLLFMALGTLAPSVILPEWRAYQAMHVARQAEQHRLASMQRVVDRERRHLQALHRDPAVLSRMAQRELRFRAPGEQVIAVSVAPVDNFERQSGNPFVPAPVVPPSAVARATSYLPDYPYDRVFCDHRTRVALMCMSVALMLLALYIPSRGAPRHDEHAR